MSGSTFVIEFPELKKSRRYGAKVKTGCITCKRRRVRCDEGKPACLRCTSAGRECEGYAQDNKKVQSRVPSPNQAVFRISPVPLESADSGIHHLEFYYRCAGQTLSSRLDNGFWSRTVLQMAQVEPCIHHALVALGYLNRTEPGSLKHARSALALDSRNQTLLYHYNKAVRHLIERMGEVSYTLEMGLVTCLLFICIEFLRGNVETAFTHLSSGLRILSAGEQGQLPVATSRVTYHGSNTMIKENLVPIFTRTITSALLYVGPSPIVDVPVPCPQLTAGQVFSSVHEAQTHSMELRNASILFARLMGQKMYVKIPITAEDLQTQRQLLDAHDAWFRTLELLESQESLSEEDQVIASNMKMTYYTTCIALATAAEPLEASCDSHLPGFQALIRHAKRIIQSMNLPVMPRSTPPLSSPSSNTSSTESSENSSQFAHQSLAANFTFEISLIPSLYFTATRCRCPHTRREAVSLLSRNLPREALWDAEQAAAVAKRVIEIEEREVDPVTGWPVESSRVGATVDGDMDANGRFLVRFHGSTWHFEKEEIAWDGKTRPEVQWEEWLVV